MRFELSFVSRMLSVDVATDKDDKDQSAWWMVSALTVASVFFVSRLQAVATGAGSVEVILSL